MSAENENTEHELSSEEVLGWLEFGCWTTLLLTPFLYYVNGPAVSQDQFVVRSILVATALLGALALTGRRFFGARRTSSGGTDSER